MVEKKKKKKDKKLSSSSVRKPVGDTPTAQQKREARQDPFYKEPFSFPSPTKDFFERKSPNPLLRKTEPFSFPSPTKDFFERKTPVDKDGNPLSLRQQEDRLRKSPRKFESGGMVGRRGKSRK